MNIATNKVEALKIHARMNLPVGLSPIDGLYYIAPKELLDQLQCRIVAG